MSADAVEHRVLVRRFEVTDLDPFLAYQGLPAVRRHLPGVPMTTTEAASYVALQSTLPLTAREAWHAFAIHDIAAGHMIGDVGVWLPSGQGSTATGDIGFQLHPAWHGNGIASEAMRIFLPYAFTAFGLDEVTATCQRANVASATLLRRLGLELVNETDTELMFRQSAGPLVA